MKYNNPKIYKNSLNFVNSEESENNNFNFTNSQSRYSNNSLERNQQQVSSDTLDNNSRRNKHSCLSVSRDKSGRGYKPPNIPNLNRKIDNLSQTQQRQTASTSCGTSASTKRRSMLFKSRKLVPALEKLHPDARMLPLNFNLASSHNEHDNFSVRLPSLSTHKHLLPEYDIETDLEHLEYIQDSYISDLNSYEYFLKKFKTSPMPMIHKESNRYSSQVEDYNENLYKNEENNTQPILVKLVNDNFRILDEMEVQDPLLDHLLRHRDPSLTSQIYDDKYVNLDRYLNYRADIEMKFENISVLKKSDTKDNQLLEELLEPTKDKKYQDSYEEYENKVHEITKNNF